MTINVSLTTTAAGQPSLSIKPPALTFAFVKGGAASSQSISVANAGGGSLSFRCGHHGLRRLLALRFARQRHGWSLRLFGGQHHSESRIACTRYMSGTVVVSSANPAQSAVIPVTMTVSAVLQTILIPQTGLTFFAVQGGAPRRRNTSAF